MTNVLLHELDIDHINNIYLLSQQNFMLKWVPIKTREMFCYINKAFFSVYGNSWSGYDMWKPTVTISTICNFIYV